MNDIAQARFDQQYAKHVSALKLQGHARKTIESYSYALRRLGAYFDRCPDDLTLDELTGYFTHLIDTRSWSLIKVERNGIRCYYRLPACARPSAAVDEADSSAQDHPPA